MNELTNKKLDIWGAGDRNPSTPPVSGGPTISGSCMPDDVVTEFDSRNGSGVGSLHIGYISGYQGCSSGPAWGNSYAGQIGVDFNEFVPTRDDVWWQPSVASCLGSRTYNKTVDPGQICTVIGANVWEVVTMHYKLGPRGLCTNKKCLGPQLAAATRYQTNHTYAANSFVVDSNGNFERTYGGGTTGGSEPTWPTAGGGSALTDSGGVAWYFWASPTDWFTNSYFWLAFGWEGHPSTPLIYRGPFDYYSPRSFTLDYGNPAPLIGKLHLFPYRQACFDQAPVVSKTGTTVTIQAGNITETFPAGGVVTDTNTGYTTLTTDAHVGDTVINVADTTSLVTSSVRLWRTLLTGNRWYKEVLIANGSTLADPFGIQPIAWPTPPNTAASWPGSSAPAAGLVPAAPAHGRPTPPHIVP